MEPRDPIVLVHGLLGVDLLKIGNITIKDYFPKIREELANAGYRVYSPQLSLTESVAKRAMQLRHFILREVPNQRIHLFAHSMGGLDSRYMVSKLDMADRVASITTIGTPHRGTPFADWGVRYFGWAKIFLNIIGLTTRAFYDLTQEHCQRFNEEILDIPTIRYRSIVGKCPAAYYRPHWVISTRILERYCNGEHDGIVPIASAIYGESTEIWEADHLNLVNWNNPIATPKGIWPDRAKEYVRLAKAIVG